MALSFSPQNPDDPRRLYKTAEKLERVYSEWMTGNSAWEAQVISWFATFEADKLMADIEPPTTWCHCLRYCFIVR